MVSKKVYQTAPSIADLNAMFWMCPAGTEGGRGTCVQF